MEHVTLDGYDGKLGIADLDAGVVAVLAQFRGHIQALLGAHAADQVNHHLACE